MSTEILILFVVVIIAVVVIGHDLTIRKNAQLRVRESEERYRTLFEQNPLPMWVFDLDTLKFLAVNEAAIRHYGYSREEFLSMTLENIRPKEDISVLFHDLAAISERGNEVNVRRHRKRDGSLIQVEVYARDFVLENRRARLVLANDVTAQKIAEEQVRKLNDELEKRVAERTAELEVANKELEAFSYSVSHDLRAPLRHINAFSRMLMEKGSDLPEQMRLYLRRIGDSVRRMNGLIEDLLALAHVTRQEFTFLTTGLSSIVAPVIEELRQETLDRSIEWRTAQLPSVECDPLLMRQVFRNLLDNSVKFTRHRDNAIIEIGTIEDHGEEIVYIRDNGVGFSMKYSQKLFGVFERLHRQEDFEGTGVGLAIVQRIIQRHGGRVWAEAEINKGATFYLAFGKANENSHDGK
jgi:PAS domain S-box-containing protein